MYAPRGTLRVLSRLSHLQVLADARNDAISPSELKPKRLSSENTESPRWRLGARRRGTAEQALGRSKRGQKLDRESPATLIRRATAPESSEGAEWLLSTKRRNSLNQHGGRSSTSATRGRRQSLRRKEGLGYMPGEKGYMLPRLGSRRTAVLSNQEEAESPKPEALKDDATEKAEKSPYQSFPVGSRVTARDKIGSGPQLQPQQLHAPA